VREIAPPAWVINLISLFYERIFHEKISDEVRSFLKSLSYLAVGTLIATVLGLVFNILTGRILGPTEYGRFALVQSVAAFLYIPMLIGGSAMVKYASEKEDFDRQSKIISTTYVLTFLFTIASVTIYLIFSPQLSNLFSIPPELFYLSIVFAVLFVLYARATSALRGLFKMNTLALFLPIYAAISLFAFLFFVFAKDELSFKAIVYPTFIAYGVTGVILVVFFLRKYLRFKLDRSWASILTQYGMFALIGGLSTAFYTNIDKILINRYMTVADVGIYRAYYLASINVAGLLWGTFNTVFFPTASKYKNKRAIFEKINKLLPYLIGLGMPSILLCEFIVLKFYGGGYPIDFPLMLLFAATSILAVWYGLYDWTFCSEGMRGVKLVNIGTITIAILNVFLNIYLIPRFGLYGAIGSTTASFAAGVLCLSLLKRKIV